MDSYEREINPNSSLNNYSLDNQEQMMEGRIRQVHMPEETAEYGIKFVRNPSEEEQESVKSELRRAAVKTKKHKSYNADSPGLTAALRSTDSDEWVKAINIEYETLGLENTWEAVLVLPEGKPWIPSHMVLVRQKYANGDIKKYKARLVANGSRQPWSTYTETSSPTARENSVKFFYAKAAAEGRIVRTFDVKAAYLKSDLDEEIYMLLPKANKEDKCQFVRLLKSIYGLKQAGKLWFENIRGVLLSNGYKQCPCDQCVFTKYIPEDDIDIDICLYVDDLLTTSANIKSADLLLKELRSAYGDVNETTTTKTHLGINWEHTPAGLKINQPGYIQKIITDTDMIDCEIAYSPFRNLKRKHNEIDSIHTPELTDKLRSIVGLLNHAAIHTRPDILFATSFLATRMTEATQSDIEDGLQIVKYLKGTPTLGLTFANNVAPILESFMDASHLLHWDSKGHSGLAYRLGTSKTACFDFISKKQSLVTRSSTDAEIYVIDRGVHDIEWLRQLMSFLRCPQQGPTTIHEDNEPCIFLTTGNAKYSNKSKHIQWRYYYALQAISEGTAIPKYIDTDEQIADILTKFIESPKKFYYLRSKLMNCENTKSGL
jgi:hypothetical protein